MVARTLIAAVGPLPLLNFIAGMLQDWWLARQLEQKKLTTQAGTRVVEFDAGYSQTA